MQFLTDIQIPRADYEITHEDKVLCLGSCFAQNIGQRMHESGFQTTINPFGAIYNPLSLRRVIEVLTSPKSVIENLPLLSEKSVWEKGQDLYHSMLHAHSFSRSTEEETRQAVVDSYMLGRKALQEATVVVLTLGTAFVYEYEGEVVNNCHKLPERLFTRRRMSVDEAADAVADCLHLLSGKHVILTVSPLRHIRDGLHENNLSKSTLLLAVNKVQSSKFQNQSSKFKVQGSISHACNEMRQLNIEPLTLHGSAERKNYFPAYELLLDVLRDYRFYASDMLHPSETAVGYIWERFQETYMSSETRQIAAERYKHFPRHIKN